MTPARPWVAYVGPFQFPWGQPGSRRVYGNARSILEAGFDVTVCSADPTPNALQELHIENPEHRLTFIGLAEFPSPSTPAPRRAWQWLYGMGERTAEWLDSQATLPSHVIVYGGSSSYMHHVGRWCRRRGVPLIADVVEWYDPRSFKGGRLGPFSFGSMLGHRYFHKRADGIIAISSYLESYYKTLGLETIRVPPTTHMDPASSDSDRRRGGSVLQIAYCGTPGKKDEISTVIKAIEACNSSPGREIELVVAGPSEQELLRFTPNNAIPTFLRSLGPIEQDKVAAVVRDADFVAIVRAPKRSSNAGFPTKFVESLAAGTPVVANLTSDLGMYLTDNMNGLVVGDNSLDSMVRTLERAKLLDEQQLETMRRSALETAKEFDWRGQTESFAHLLQTTRKRLT